MRSTKEKERRGKERTKEKDMATMRAKEMENKVANNSTGHKEKGMQLAKEKE